MQSICGKYSEMRKFADMPCAMTVAGSDSGAGAGIQADILAMAANGVYACSAITALTAQNPDAVRRVLPSGAEFAAEQMRAVCDFYKPSAAKTGMLFDAETAAAVAEFFAARPEIRLAVDPVLVSTSGSRLLEGDAAEILKNSLIPLAEVFTPNLDEGAVLLGADKIENVADAARALYEKYGVPVLLKGGHLKGGAVTDVLFDENGPLEMPSARICGVDTHGSGCTLSAAIAANFAKGLGLRDACRAAREYLRAGMSDPLKVGGRNFINHFPQK